MGIVSSYNNRWPLQAFVQLHLPDTRANADPGSWAVASAFTLLCVSPLSNRLRIYGHVAAAFLSLISAAVLTMQQLICFLFPA